MVREFMCPGCNVLFDSEVNRRAEPPVKDIEIHF
jgi:acetone carboxylase gamma subunit